MNSYEESNSDVLTKTHENENAPLTSMEIIELYNDIPAKPSKSRWKDYLTFFCILFLIIALIIGVICLFKFLTIRDIDSYKLAVYKFHEDRIKTKKILDSKSNDDDEDSYKNTEKLKIGFLYPTITKSYSICCSPDYNHIIQF